jgi:hypothetical protein
MPDPGTPPQSLLDQAASSPGSAVASLLAPLVSGGAVAPRGGNLLSDSDIASAVPSFLAFGARLAAAGAPTLGPPTPLPVALTSGMDAGYNAARQQQMLPVLQQAAAREAAAQDLDLQQKQFEFDRSKSLWDMTKQFMSPGGDNFQLAPPGAVPGAAPGATPVVPTPGASAAPGPGGLPAGAAGSATAIAQLPDVKALPDTVRVPVIQTAAERGMSLDEAALWARMIKAESGGVHIDQNTGAPLASAKGALGAGQVMPATFNEMAQKYGIKGSIGDLMPNLQASANYFHEGVVDNGGNLNAAAVRYNAGPRGLASYQANGSLPPETADFLSKTAAPPPPGSTGAYYDASSGRSVPIHAPLFAGPGAPGQPPAQPGQPPGQPAQPAQPQPPATGPSSGADPLVIEPLTHAVVPRSIAQAAMAALRGGEIKQSGSGLAAGAAVVNDYLQKRAALPSYVPGAPGVQTQSQTGQTSEAPLGATISSPLTDAERQRFVPNALPSTAYVGQRYTSGPYAGQIKGDIQALPVGEAPTEISPLTPEENAAIDPHKLPGVDYVGKRYTSGPNAGKLASVEPLNPRGANLPFQQTMELNNQVESSNPWKLWTAGQARYDAVMASLNEGSRAGDRAAVESLAKVFDPNVEVSSDSLKASGTYGGIPQMLQTAWGYLTGSAPLPDDVRQQIASLATAEMKTRDLAALQQVQRTRALAGKIGVPQENIEPGFSPLALGKDEAPGAPPNMTFPQPWQFNPATRKFARAQPQGATDGAQPPAASQQPPGATTPPGATPGGATQPNAGAPVTDRLTVPGLQAIPSGAGGLARLGADISANGDKYTPADKQRFLDEVKRRGHL